MADHSLKLKESKHFKKRKVPRPCKRTGKKLCNKQVTMIQIVIGALVTDATDWCKKWLTWKLLHKWRP